ncbi:DUF4870 domain-containing protein [Thalassotalea ganghwensis]
MTHIHTESHPQYDMAKVVAILSYVTVVGWLVAIFLYGRHHSPFARFHLKQSLGLIVTAAALSFIPLIGWLINFILALYWLFALCCAIRGQQYLVPIVGQYYQEHLDFIR